MKMDTRQTLMVPRKVACVQNMMYYDVIKISQLAIIRTLDLCARRTFRLHQNREINDTIGDGNSLSTNIVARVSCRTDWFLIKIKGRVAHRACSNRFVMIRHGLFLYGKSDTSWLNLARADQAWLIKSLPCFSIVQRTP